MNPHCSGSRPDDSCPLVYGALELSSHARDRTETVPLLKRMTLPIGLRGQRTSPGPQGSHLACGGYEPPLSTGPSGKKRGEQELNLHSDCARVTAGWARQCPVATVESKDGRIRTLSVRVGAALPSQEHALVNRPSSGSGGNRTHSIPSSKLRWSARCLPSRFRSQVPGVGVEPTLSRV